jgi:transcriptional regulator GlxA family with amidase domain
MSHRRALMLFMLATAALVAACASLRPDPSNLGPATIRPAPFPDIPTRPVIAILTDPDGTETTDFVVPYALLKRWGGAEVVAVSPGGGQVKLMPALSVAGTVSMPDFAARHPGGADIVIVPATHRPNAPALTGFLKSEAAHGALILSICDGAATVAAAGLLEGRQSASHWYGLKRLARAWPDTRWVTDRRYLFDGNRASSSGVSASVPIILELIARLAGQREATRLAGSIGTGTWTDRHDSTAYRLALPMLTTAILNRILHPRDTLAIAVSDDTDALALALQADAWARTWRAKPIAVAAAGAITTADGLTFLTETAAPEGSIPLPLQSGPAVGALAPTLAAIGNRYGAPTARFVALQLELPPA